MRMRLMLGLVVAATTLVVACGDDTMISTAAGGSGTTSAIGGSGGNATSTANGGNITSFAATGGSGMCESGIICGAGNCCAAGQECVLDTCLDACASQVRCGADLSTCCPANDVCLSGSCSPQGADCIDWADCNADEFCEPTIGKCLKQPTGGNICENKPDPMPIAPIEEWSWIGSTIFPDHKQVINMPVVMDLENDGTPDVVIVTSNSYGATGVGYLRALSGDTGIEKWAASNDVYLAVNQVNPRATPAAADIDGDGFPEIVTAKRTGGLIAFEHDGTFKWTSTNTDGVTPFNPSMASVTIAIADLEGDGTPEIIAGGQVYEATGQLRFDNGALAGSNNGGYGAVSIVADVDGIGDQEIVTGRRAFRSDGTVLWDNGLVDGYPAIGDLDLDGTPELVVVAGGTVRIQNPLTGAVIASMAMPAAGAGGPPTIANFDADPEPEFASANGGAYAVFKFDPSIPAITLLWSEVTQDLSSNRTGSSVFDFQGDGVAEVVYADECYFRVYNGQDGTVLYEIENASATIHEYPVVVDVDGDNNTEVIVAANNLSHVSGGVNCPYPGNQAKAGVFAYGDANDNWVRTRKLWNQHAYHITNISGDASVPAPESVSWIAPGLNNYRQSNQGAGVFNAPDLQVSLNANLLTCPTAITLQATVVNQGSLGVPAGIPVTFYAGTDATGTLIATVNTTQILLPGQFEVVTTTAPNSMVAQSFFVVVDGNAGGMSTQDECLEDNNDALVSDVICPSAN